jgi:hypothetical protein
LSVALRWRAGSVLSASPLQRRPRDIHAFGQHVMLSEIFYARAGPQHLGFPPVDPISDGGAAFQPA